MAGSSWAYTDDCPTCDGSRVVEVANFGTFAAEATREVPCSRCCKPEHAADANRHMNLLARAARENRRRAA